MRSIGVHLRVTTTLSAVLQTARALGMNIFQCFLSEQASGLLVRPDKNVVRDFLAVKGDSFSTLYVHASYKINLCNTIHNRSWLLRKELALAKQFRFTHMILHPGSARGARSKDEGIEALARTLNRILRTEYDIQIVLENVAHGGMSIGGDLDDFKILLTKLDQPDRISFCIDTAHAYSYGYDLVNDLEGFINTIESTIGSQRVALLHVNDTSEKCGGKIDRHQLLGQGLLGIEVLKSFATHPSLSHTPIIVELPAQGNEKEMIEMVRSWEKSVK